MLSNWLNKEKLKLLIKSVQSTGSRTWNDVKVEIKEDIYSRICGGR